MEYLLSTMALLMCHQQSVYMVNHSNSMNGFLTALLSTEPLVIDAEEVEMVFVDEEFWWLLLLLISLLPKALVDGNPEGFELL